MTGRFPTFCLLLATGAYLARGAAGGPEVTARVPIKNFQLPTFTKAGDRAMLLLAGEAFIVSQTQVEVTDLNLTLFSGDATNRVDTVLVSPAATVLLDQQIVRGNSTVRLVRDDLEVTGEQWSYSHQPAEKKVLIENKARVVFRAQLPDLLK